MTDNARAVKALRDGFRREIFQLHLDLIDAAPGAARKPIYTRIRRIKKLIARMDKFLTKLDKSAKLKTATFSEILETL